MRQPNAQPLPLQERYPRITIDRVLGGREQNAFGKTDQDGGKNTESVTAQHQSTINVEGRKPALLWSRRSKFFAPLPPIRSQN